MQRSLLAGVMLVAVATSALAQEYDRITPAEQTNPDASILTTHDVPATGQPAAPSAPLPWQEAPLPQPAQPVIHSAPPLQAPMGTYKPKIPFGRGEAVNNGPVIPDGPRSTVAVPVVDVDELEAAEPQPPTPVEAEADPAQEDPTEPTDLTAPIFDGEKGDAGPQKIIIRALNKVTAQSELIEFKPEQTITFGQLEITALNCRTSSPTSQTDYAALLDIAERLPGKEKELKPLFRGWMYASSPSIAALEHPVYDVTMVECKQTPVAPKPEEKPAAKPAKKAKN